MEWLKKQSANLWLFFLCAVVVFFVHFTLYQPVIQYRLFNITEDWPFLVFYRSLYPNPLASVLDVWTNTGLHTTAQIYHIGILSDFLGFNYSAYQIVNVVLKAVGTLSFFPLILVLFKNKKLAFIATILFGMSSATAASFLWVVKGSEYLAIATMNIFLITYYYTIQKNSKKLLFLSGLLILIAYLFAPPRMFPLPMLIPLVEIYWLIKTRKFSNLKYSIIRAIMLTLPIILISKPAPVSSIPFTSRPPILFKDIINGNWQNLLDPFAGIGWTLFTNDFWNFFGILEIETFKNLGNYLIFMLRGPVIIFGLFTLFLAPILSKNWKRFFILVFGLNFIFEILLFFIASHHFSIPKELVMPYAPGQFLTTKYPSFIGIYIFIIAFACFLEWRKNKEQDNLYKAIWVGPIFSVVFLWPTWIIMGLLINDYSSVHWYFGIPAMGTTLFMAAILVLFYEKFKHKKIAKSFVTVIIIGIIFIFYQNHGVAIAKQYLGINPERVSLDDQSTIQGKLIDKLGSSARNGDLLIYLDIAGDSLNLRRTTQYYKEALVVTRFGYWVHFRRSGNGVINNGCIDTIADKELLKSIVGLKDGRWVFRYNGYCVDKPAVFTNKDKIFDDLNNFYAFKLQDGEFIDIKEEILKELKIL